MPDLFWLRRMRGMSERSCGHTMLELLRDVLDEFADL